ncbi:MAG: hypothetical protein FD177_2085 [Desulfovibrionaceae bacterium]|nr:MAG: hypothetical protein FD177_2085 [Desulfovibrionaceae bacterium]
MLNCNGVGRETCSWLRYYFVHSFSRFIMIENATMYAMLMSVFIRLSRLFWSKALSFVFVNPMYAFVK